MRGTDRHRPRSGSRPFGSRPLADLVGPAIDPIVARQGFGESDLILYWEDIVGGRLAAMSEPISLRWPPRGANYRSAPPEPATLVVRVESGFALEMQHLTDVVIGRVNAHLGWNCIGRITLKQGPLARRSAEKPQRRRPSAATRTTAEAHVADVADANLRQALARLGAHIIERSASGKTP